jgi:hypothetical protein
VQARTVQNVAATGATDHHKGEEACWRLCRRASIQINTLRKAEPLNLGREFARLSVDFRKSVQNNRLGVLVAAVVGGKHPWACDDEIIEKPWTQQVPFPFARWLAIIPGILRRWCNADDTLCRGCIYGNIITLLGLGGTIGRIDLGAYFIRGLINGLPSFSNLYILPFNRIECKYKLHCCLQHPPAFFGFKAVPLVDLVIAG